MPVAMIGRKLSTGPGAWTPNRSERKPIWKIAVMPPKAASSDSTNPSVAVSGTRIERNTSTRMSSDSPTTSAR